MPAFYMDYDSFDIETYKKNKARVIASHLKFTPILVIRKKIFLKAFFETTNNIFWIGLSFMLIIKY